MTTAAQRPDQVALRSPDDAFSLTFAQLLRRLAATASILHDLGLRKGDALGLMMLNRPEFHVVDAAAMLLGATPFSLYNTSPAEQIAFVMGDAGTGWWWPSRASPTSCARPPATACGSSSSTSSTAATRTSTSSRTGARWRPRTC